VAGPGAREPGDGALLHLQVVDETSSSLESEAMDAIEADENLMGEIEVDENGNMFDLDF
jgi:uncharacterized protein YuzE